MLLPRCRCAKVKLDRNIIINTENDSVVPFGTKVLLEREKLCEYLNTKNSGSLCQYFRKPMENDLIFCSM